MEGLRIQINLVNVDNAITGFLILVSGGKVYIFLAVGKLIKFLDWTCVAIIPPCNFVCLFIPQECLNQNRL